MKILSYPNYNQLSEAAGNLIVERIDGSVTCLIGLATGFSPKLTYNYVGKQLTREPSLVPKIKGMQLDEWYGLSRENPGSCMHYLNLNVIKPWQLNSDQCLFIDGQHSDQEIQISEMKKSLSHRQMDICILGLGKNGHLAMNEPGSKLDVPCRIVDLDFSSKTHSMLMSVKATVQKSITIGLKEILESKEIILLVTGLGKKEAFQKFLDKKPVEVFPASAIYHHDNWKCFVDESSVK